MTYHHPGCYLCTNGRGSWLCERHQIESFERSARILDECEAHAKQRAEDDAAAAEPPGSDGAPR